MESYRRLSFEERVKMDTYRGEGYSIGEIAHRLKRSKSSISREFRRYPETYEPKKADLQSRYFQRFRRKWFQKLDRYELQEEVFTMLRRRWSPDQISVALKEKYPDDRRMQISHESIYTYIYVLPRGELKSKLVGYLRRKKKTRRKRRLGAKTRRTRNPLPEMISIEERPPEVRDRSLPGHWEGDLIIGKDHQSAIGTLVERKTRAVILVPLKSPGVQPGVVRRAFERAVERIPKELKLTLTYDQGMEMREHRLFTKHTKMKVYFCHPASPWERGTCENTNSLIRDFFPKGTDFSTVTKRQLLRVQHLLNERPRKTLGYRTPKQVFDEEVLKVLR